MSFEFFFNSFGAINVSKLFFRCEIFSSFFHDIIRVLDFPEKTKEA